MEIYPIELYHKINRKQSMFLLDVRTEEEYKQDCIEGVHLIPINELPLRTEEIPRNKIIITICAHGNRSMRAAIYLKEKKYDVFSLKGGMEAWNDFIKNKKEN
ncbi:rhodanese-like domain-containing protein [Candidatus Woesearchaeota archaeon]|nr:rhodanese-like domain-containing protein [Candidatus Woesearchaeota archaeon]